MVCNLESVPEHRSATAAGLLGTGRYVGSIPASLMVALVLSDGVTGVNLVLGLAACSILVAWAASTRLSSATSAL